MVEAAFMFPMFLILWFVAQYAHNTYSKKIALTIATRGASWGYVMSNCGKGAGSSAALTKPPTGQSANSYSYSASQAPSFSNVASSAGGGVSGYMGAIGGLLGSIPLFANPDGAQAQQNTQVSFRIPNNYANDPGVGSTPITAQMTLFCNEVPQTGNIMNVLSDIWGLLSGLIHLL